MIGIKVWSKDKFRVKISIVKKNQMKIGIKVLEREDA